MNKPKDPILETLILQFDGGCRPTNPGNKYGSFQCSRKTRSGRVFPVMKVLRAEFGPGTNNEAEFNALEYGLSMVTNDLTKGGFDCGRYGLSILTDSLIVMNHLLNPSQILSKDARTSAMQVLARGCLQLMDLFPEYSVNWVSRVENVKAFGH